MANPSNQAKKSWLVALILAVFFGHLGVDRFYLGKIGTGVLKLVTVGGFGIWWLIDVIMIVSNSTTSPKASCLQFYSVQWAGLGRSGLL